MPWSDVVVPKKHFLFTNYCFKLREYSFSEYSISLFHKLICGGPFLSGCCITFRRALVAMPCVYTMYLTDISITDVLLFQRSTFSHTFDGTDIISGDPFQWSSFLKGTVKQASLKQALAIIPFIKGTELIHHSNCSHSFDEWPVFYYKRAVATKHSFKFTISFQNRTCCKEISLLQIMITSWYQIFIYWNCVFLSYHIRYLKLIYIL